MGARRLIDCFVPTRPNTFNGHQQATALALLQQSSHPFKLVLFEQIEEFAKRLTVRREGLAEQGFEAWANLLNEALRSGRSAGVRAAAVTLKFAFNHPTLNASPLVIVAFPVVYRAVSSPNYVYDVSGLFSFLDWDRAKVLRAQLVDSFLASVWPPSDLLVIAECSDIGRRILKRIARERQGWAYIERMKADLRTRPETIAQRALDRIEEFEHNPPPAYEWD
jgi:hypothetical protein